jgi:ATP-dependent Lon protease
VGGAQKSGRSAGLPTVAACLSLASGKQLPGRVAFTGEVTGLGAVLPVGDLREKVVAADQAGMLAVVVPALNLSQFQVHNLLRRKHLR